VRSSRRLLLSVVFVIVLVALFWVPWDSLAAAGTGWPTPVVVVLTVVFAVTLVSFPVMMMWGHGRRHRDWAARIGDITLGAVWVFFVWSLFGDLARLVLLLAGAENPTSSRIVAVAVLVVAVGLLAWGHFEAMRVPRVKEVDVTVARLGRGLDGLRIVVVTDTHFGPLDRANWSAKVSAVVNELEPDIACHAGDIADGEVEQREVQAGHLESVRAKLAKAYITGNHEYFSQAQDWVDYMARIGWNPLRNSHVVLERGGDRLILAGVDDATAASSKVAGHGADLTAALAGTDPELPVVLLAHQPKQVTAAVAAGVDLQISGHTHGGQIWPFRYLVKLDQPSVSGLSRHGDRTQLYTSRGSGFWGPPFRVFAPSEITLITLRAA
jgi:predicted MPP superfamily phosphohydrolase